MSLSLFLNKLNIFAWFVFEIFTSKLKLFNTRFLSLFSCFHCFHCFKHLMLKNMHNGGAFLKMYFCMHLKTSLNILFDLFCLIKTVVLSCVTSFQPTELNIRSRRYCSLTQLAMWSNHSFFIQNTEVTKCNTGNFIALRESHIHIQKAVKSKAAGGRVSAFNQTSELYDETSSLEGGEMTREIVTKKFVISSCPHLFQTSLVSKQVVENIA